MVPFLPVSFWDNQGPESKRKVVAAMVALNMFEQRVGEAPSVFVTELPKAPMRSSMIGELRHGPRGVYGT